ncbi:MAG: EAL domain-containing protein [Candidatus Igneacidithiobacillus chanchocoensis]
MPSCRANSGTGRLKGGNIFRNTAALRSAEYTFISANFPSPVYALLYFGEATTTLTPGEQERGFEGKILNYRKDGSSFWNHLTITPIRDHHGRVVQYAAVQRDLGRETLPRLLEGDDALLHDPLTALMNRRALEEELPRARNRADRSERLLAMVVIDLDDFKALNDRLGRDRGDLILQRTAKRLRKVLRHGDSIARFGGDEFILLLEGLRDLNQLESVLAKVAERLQRPIDLGDDEKVSIAMSMGASIYPLSHHDNLELLLREADQAMFEAKRNKSGRERPWAFWSSDVDRYPLRALFRSGALQAWYQPVWDQRRQQVVGIEALARLVDGEGRVYSPGEFLCQLAEEDLFALTQQMLLRAVAELQVLDALGFSLWVSVNIDPQLVGVTCVQFLQRLLRTEKIDPRRIVLELLESHEFADQALALDRLQELKSLGFQLAIDDVGSGYSSLLRLKQLPIDKAKLDQGFIRTLEEHPRDLSFVQSVVDLARGLDIDLVAEGVETVAIRDAIGVLGMRYLQGYAIARPMPFVDLQAFLSQQQLSISAPLPPTLLSAYAFHLTNFSLLEKAFDHDPGLLDLVSLANADACQEQQRLLALGLVPEHELFYLHAEYHQHILGLRESDGSPSLRGWAQLEDCHRRFAAALLQAFQLCRGES